MIEIINTWIIHDDNYVLLKRLGVDFPDDKINISDKYGKLINIEDQSDIRIKKIINEPCIICLPWENPMIEWFFSIYIPDFSKYCFESDYHLFELSDALQMIIYKDTESGSERIKFLYDALNFINR